MRHSSIQQRDVGMTPHYHSMTASLRSTKTLMMRLSLKDSLVFSIGMLVSQRRSQCLILVTLLLLLNKYISFISTGTILKHGVNFLNMMSMILEKLKIGMKDVIWRKKTRRSEINI